MTCQSSTRAPYSRRRVLNKAAKGHSSSQIAEAIQYTEVAQNFLIQIIANGLVKVTMPSGACCSSCPGF